MFEKLAPRTSARIYFIKSTILLLAFRNISIMC